MDLGLSEEQEMLKNFARDFLEKESPEKLVRDMEEDDRGYTDVDASNLSGATLGTFGYSHKLAHYYSPTEVSFGVAISPTSAWLMSLDLSWSRWSGYLDSNQDNYDGEITHDTLTPRVGMQWRAHPSTEVMGGYFYERSAFDNEGGWTNFVDPDRHVTSVGTRTDLATLFGGSEDSVPIRLGWHAQLQMLQDRREIKDWEKFESQAEAEANSGWPGWQASGWGFNVGLSLDTEF